jgi:hypothetical protein
MYILYDEKIINPWGNFVDNWLAGGLQQDSAFNNFKLWLKRDTVLSNANNAGSTGCIFDGVFIGWDAWERIYLL